MEEKEFLCSIDEEVEKRYPLGTTPPMPASACAYHNAAQIRLRETFKEAAKWGYEQANTLSKEMTVEEKQIEFKPKPWALYNNDEFVESFESHKAAKRALHNKCEICKKYPYDYADDYYTIKPYTP